ncbi:WD40 repeat domain-containing protein [Actinacidiphila paucisporea]|uniref:WD40 repeat n=1 Tax=Actinacidiphila paucisporea TaxID=310782 RepID=A0A1M7PXX6_9ACTN|nr:WD40 repeat domain-containing protein [Actinacidiphila paucisporea]SHN22642.1 WD40 repeat [Actinacidiphila paucisporea]
MATHDRTGAVEPTGPQADFAAQLTALSDNLTTLRIERGNPSLRAIRDSTPKGQPVGITTIGKILGGKGLPRQEHLLSVVRVLLSMDHDARLTTTVPTDDPALQPWRERWRTLVRLQRQTSTEPLASGLSAPEPVAPGPRGSDLADNPPPDTPAAQETLSVSGPPVPDHPVALGQTTKSADRPGTENDVPFSPNGTPFATSRDGARLWGTADDIPSSIAVSRTPPPTERTLQVDLDSFGVLSTLPLRDFPAQTRDPVAFSRDTTLLATGDDEVLRLWDTATQQQIGEPLQHTRKVFALTFSPDSTVLATVSGSPNGVVRLWDTATRQQIGEPLQHTGTVFALAFSPDSTVLATADTGRGNGRVQLWDLGTRQPVGTPLQDSGTVYAVAFSPDSSLLATAGGSGSGVVRLWNPATRQSVGNPLWLDGPAIAVAFSPDGTLLATAGDSGNGVVRLWNPATQQQIGNPLQDTGTVFALAFSPDSTLLASAETPRGKGTVRLWNSATQQQIGNPLLHPGTVEAVAFSPDSTLLATARDDNSYSRAVIRWAISTKQRS